MFSCSRQLLPLMTVFALFFTSLWNIETAFAETLLHIQDPTRPAVTTGSDLENGVFSRFQNLNLSSTLISSRRSIAIINGRIFEQGQTVEEAEVADIQPGAVELRHDGVSHWLYTTFVIEKKSHPVGGPLH